MDYKNQQNIYLLKRRSRLRSFDRFLSTFSNYTLSTLAINANQDVIKNYDLVEKIRTKTKIKADLPIQDPQKITEEISQSKIVISDRLHSSLAGIFFEARTITFNNVKNRRVIKILRMIIRFYKNTFEIPFVIMIVFIQNTTLKIFHQYTKKRLKNSF